MNPELEQCLRQLTRESLRRWVDEGTASRGKGYRNRVGEIVAVGDSIATKVCGTEPSMKPALLLDTDMLTDCDDAAALAMAFGMERQGECRLLGITVSSAHPDSVAVVSAIADFYGRGGLPVGAPAPGEGYRRDDSCFLGPVAAEFPHRVNGDTAERAVPLMRRALTAEPDGSVTLVTIGYHSNVRSLLCSAPDAISPLSGRDLAARKIRDRTVAPSNGIAAFRPSRPARDSSSAPTATPSPRPSRIWSRRRDSSTCRRGGGRLAQVAGLKVAKSFRDGPAPNRDGGA